MTWKPARAIEIVAGTPPGGGLDRAARMLATAIEATGVLDVPAIVVNIGGEGGRRAWRHIEGHAGDAHVITISAPNLMAEHMMGVTPMDPEWFTPLAILFSEDIAIVVRSDSGIDSGADLIRRFAENAAGVTIALSTSLGNSNHVALAKLIRHAGADTRAPAIRVFDTALDSVADVVAGNADVGAITAASPVKEIESGRLRCIGISSSSRLPGLYAATPTWTEQGVDCVVQSWRGVSGPPRLDVDRIDFWQNALTAVVRSPQWKAGLAGYFWTEMVLSGSALRDYLQRERAEMRIILHELGLLAR